MSWTRDRLARGLIRIGVTPNGLTLIGLAMTVAAAVCLAVGLARPGSDSPPLPGDGGQANFWLWGAAGLIVLAGSMDILDGAVARLGNRSSAHGAFLDSALDRVSDVALFAGMAAGFAWRGNFTYPLLAILAMGHALITSYTRARAENLIANCKVGYWERGERVAAILIASMFYQVPAVLWQLATLPMLTVIRRIAYALRVVSHRQRTGEDLSAGQPKPIRTGIYRLALWRYPRSSNAYLAVTVANILWIILAPISGQADPIRRWLEALAG